MTKSFKLFLLLATIFTPHVAMAAWPSAEDVKKATGLRQGLTVVLGATDGRLEAGLAADGRMLIQTLTTDAATCAKAREHLFSQGLYGQASVDFVPSVKKLPYYNMLVNLLIADCDALGADSPSIGEIMRVLAFEGVAFLKHNGRWQKHVRPKPDNVADYSHGSYDATRSNMSPDEQVGPPNALRWVGKPAEDTGCHVIRVKNGVILLRTVAGRGTKSNEPRELFFKLPGVVVAKDAYSGVTLWTRLYQQENGMISPWIDWGAAGEECVFLYTHGTQFKGKKEGGYKGDPTYREIAIEAWDLRTGELRHRFPLGNSAVRSSRSTEEERSRESLTSGLIAVADGCFVHSDRSSITVRDEKSGETKYQIRTGDDLAHFRKYFVADGKLVAEVVRFQERGQEWRRYMRDKPPLDSLRAWSLADGRELWRIPRDRLLPKQGLPQNEVVVMAMGGYVDGQMTYTHISSKRSELPSVVALIDVAEGKVNWVSQAPTLEARLGGGMAMEFETFIRNGRVYVAQLVAVRAEFDLETGRCLNDRPTWQGGRVGNCTTGTATTRYLLAQRNFTPWDELRENSGKPQFWYSKLYSFQCNSKTTPALGTTFMFNGNCNCTTHLPGAKALYGLEETVALPDDQRRQTGYPGLIAGAVDRQDQAYESIVAYDWKLRPGRTAMTWSAPKRKGELAYTVGNRAKGSTEVWGYGKRETDPIEVGDLIVRAYVDEHRVEATRDGEVVWNFVAGGRIGFRGPVQFDDRRIYFASHDGHIYAVNHADGSLVWRVLVAPADRRMVAFGQVESACPLFNVVLHEDRLYGCAGRHHELDGGLHFMALDPASGDIVWHVDRRIGMADRDHVGAIHGSQQSAIWRSQGDPGRLRPDHDLTYSAWWALNGDVFVEDGKLKINQAAHDPLEIDLQDPKSVRRNEHNFTPPDARPFHVESE